MINPADPCAAALPKKKSIASSILARAKNLFTREQESNLVLHAEFEMRRAGLYSADSDYGGMIPAAVMKMVRALASEGHSGGSHALTMAIFNRVANFKTLTPITNDPSEWMNVNEYMGTKEQPMWQNRREPSTFSNDGGNTYYSVDDDDRIVKTAVPATAAV